MQWFPLTVSGTTGVSEHSTSAAHKINRQSSVSISTIYDVIRKESLHWRHSLNLRKRAKRTPDIIVKTTLNHQIELN